jgi:hypothetical protein
MAKYQYVMIFDDQIEAEGRHKKEEKNRIRFAAAGWGFYPAPSEGGDLAARRAYLVNNSPSFFSMNSVF